MISCQRVVTLNRTRVPWPLKFPGTGGSTARGRREKLLMAADPVQRNSRLRYAADEQPPHPFSFVVGLQTAILVCVPVVVITTIVTRAANQSDAYLSWAIFATMVIGGLMTIVQARRVGPVGAGNLIVMGTSGASIGVAVLALIAGGPALLGTLVVASGLCQFGFAARLALLRRIITPLPSSSCQP